MSNDARFEDGGEAPLNLGALDSDDLQVLSALVQDAVLPAHELKYTPHDRRFAMLLNRVRWEDDGRDRHGVERVQALLVFDNVLHVASQGIQRGEPDLILSVLALEFEPSVEPEDPGGHIVITLAGDGAIRLDVEAIEARLRDVTRPYRAPSGHLPAHPD